MANVGDDNKGFVLFGREPAKIPCFRQSFMNGILAGLGGGFTYFMFTSKVKRSTIVAIVSYGGVTIVSWVYCRYRLAQNMANQRLIREAIQTKILAEGTDLERQIESQTKEV